MKLRKVKPSQVKVPEVRVTSRFSEEEMEIFRQSVKQVGIVAPIILCLVNEDLVLVDGLHRLQEAVADGDQPIDMAVMEGDMVEVLTKNLFLDHARGKTPVSEMVKVIGALSTEYNLDSDQLQEKTGLTRDYIEQLIKVAQASPEVLFALDQGAIGVGVAFQLSRVPQRLIQEEILAKSTVYRLRVQDVKALVDDTLVELGKLQEQPVDTAPPAPRPAPAFNCEGCKDEVQQKYLRPVFLCPNCFGDVWKLAKAREAPKEEVSTEGDTP